MTSMSAMPHEGVSNADRAYEIILERIMMLTIRPGDPINDEQVGTELGFGRTPVREALKRLERDRLVVSYPRRGTFATAVDLTDLADISEIRTELEPLAAARAARTANAERRAELRTLATHIADMPDSDPLAALGNDVQVHRAIYRASGNPYLEDVLIGLDAHATRIWCMFLDSLPRVSDHVHEHVPLLEAIIDGDARTAERLALAHVAGFEKTIRAVL